MPTKADLRPYQQRTVTALYESNGVQAVLKMGAGKTASALTAIAELLEDGVIHKALVLAPKRVAQMTWPDEIRAWTHLRGLSYSVGLGNAAARREALNADVQVVIQTIDNIQWLVEELKGRPEDDPLFDLLCVDELSRLKNPRSKRGRALRKLGPRWKIKWGLTGTPQPNGEHEQFGPLSLLSDQRLWGRSYDKWKLERFHPTSFGPGEWALMDSWKEQTVSEIAAWSITMRPDEMPQLPELNIVPHYVEVPANVLDRYAAMSKTMVAQIRAGTIAAANAAVKMGKLEQLMQGVVYTHDIVGADGSVPERGSYELVHTAKLDVLQELSDDLNEPALIVYWYQAELIEIRRALGDVPWIGAGVSDASAAQAVRAWNEGRINRLAIHPASAGHGLNLQAGGSRFIWMAPIWSAELWDQTIARLWRPGQRQHVTVDVIRGRVPAGLYNIDDAKANRVIEKMSAQDALIAALPKV